MQVEADPSLPAGTEERFNGYGVMGLPFASGHVLVLRRFVTTSVGPGYTSVWHYAPGKGWHFYADAEPQFSCTRYFGKMAAGATVTPISINWLNDRSFEVRIKSIGLNWFVKAVPTPVTRVFNFLGKLMPEVAWKNQTVLKLMGKVAGVTLGLQRVGLTGKVPNGQNFIANPKTLWSIKESRATLAGQDLGKPFPLKQQARLQDFWIPQQGILAFGQAYFSPFDPKKHAAAPAGNYA